MAVNEESLIPERIEALRELARKAVRPAHEKMQDEEYGSHHEPTDDEVPMALDLVQFVLWLRSSSDFFSGPGLDQHHPRHEEADFYEVLAELALEYTGE